MVSLLPRLSQIRNNVKGFTLIELLVVIAIIGILAVAVLSAINPIEQINKGRDTQSNSDASQLLGAVERYYTNNQLYPWNVAITGTFNPAAPGTGWTGAPTVDPIGADVNFDGRTASANWGWMTTLRNVQEVKDNFATRLSTTRTLRVYKAAGANNSTYVCYYPSSNSQKAIADKYCTDNRANLPATVQGWFTANCISTTANPNPICIP